MTKFPHDPLNQKGGVDPSLLMYWLYKSYRNGENPTFGHNMIWSFHIQLWKHLGCLCWWPMFLSNCNKQWSNCWLDSSLFSSKCATGIQHRCCNSTWEGTSLHGAFFRTRNAVQQKEWVPDALARYWPFQLNIVQDDGIYLTVWGKSDCQEKLILLVMMLIKHPIQTVINNYWWVFWGTIDWQ